MSLPGRYKGKRKRAEPPQIIIIECPGCGWRSQPLPVWKAERDYILHLDNNHFGRLECAFCKVVEVGCLRFLPDFATLAAHVHYFHPEQFDASETDPMMLPPRAFR